MAVEKKYNLQYLGRVARCGFPSPCSKMHNFYSWYFKSIKIIIMPSFHNRALYMSKELGSKWIINFRLGEMEEKKTRIVAWNENKKQTKTITIMHKFNDKQKKTTTSDFVSILQRFWVKSIPLHSQCTFHLELLCIFLWIFYSLFKPMSLFHVGKHHRGKDQFSLFCLVPLLFPFQINVKKEVDHFSLVGKCLFRKDHFFFWHLTLLFPLSTNV